jgi:hypothetical protein
MKLTPELMKAIPVSMGKDVEITYRDCTKVTGFIQGAFSEPDGLMIHRHKWSKGDNPIIRASFNDLKEVKIESDVYQ